MNRRRLPSSSGQRPARSFPGVTAFIQLLDTQPSYAGAGSKFVTVKAGENGLEFTPLPPLAITDTFVVGSQAAMLALTAQTGDVAVRTDINQTYILQGTDPSILANWVLLLVSPTHAIGGALHTADTIANVNTKLSDGDMITTLANEINLLPAKLGAGPLDLLMIEDQADGNKKKSINVSGLPAATPAAHLLGGAQHTADTIANVNTKLSDGDMITTLANEINLLPAKAAAAPLDLLMIENASAGNAKNSINISSLPFQVRWQIVDITHVDFQIAALTKSNTLFALPAGCLILGARLKVSSIFTGPAITQYFLSLGIAGDTDHIMTEYETKTIAPGDTEYAETFCFQSFNYNAAVNLLVTARSVGANLSTSTGGAARVEIYYIPKAY